MRATDLALLPDALSRKLFDALRLTIHYDGHTGVGSCHNTLTAMTQVHIAAAPVPGDGNGQGRRGRSPLTLHHKVLVEAGPASLELERQQAHAIWDTLLWLTDAQAHQHGGSSPAEENHVAVTR